MVGVAQQADGELYKSGFLVRKVHADPDGKRSTQLLFILLLLFLLLLVFLVGSMLFLFQLRGGREAGKPSTPC